MDSKVLNIINKLRESFHSLTLEKVLEIVNNNDITLTQKIRHIFSQFTTVSVELLKGLCKCIIEFRGLWNPNKRIRLIFTCPGTVVAEEGNFLKNFPLGSLFYDEAHEIRNGVKANKLNANHKRSTFIFDLSRRVRSYNGQNYPVFALTGTPVFNDEDDMIAVLHFIGQKPECNPDYYENKETRTERLGKAVRLKAVRL